MMAAMNSRVGPAALTVFFVVILIPCFAQKGQGIPPPITLDVVVTNKAGAPQPGLQQQDFTLLDNKQPRELTSFRAVNVNAGTPAPYIEVVLVIDAINADLFEATREREGIKSFLQRNGGKLAQPVSLVLVSDSPAQLKSKASVDGNALAAQLEQYETGLRTINRSQGIYGAAERFQMSMQALSSLAAYQAAKPGRKLILWIGPGWPLLQSQGSDITTQDQQHIFHSIVTSSTQLREDHITLYNIETRGLAGTSLAQFFDYQQYLTGVKSMNQAYPPTLSLQVLAVQTGGLVLNRSNDLPSAIADEIAKSAADAGVFYVLSFAADRADHADEYHSLEVKIAKPGMLVRTRTGYYAQP